MKDVYLITASFVGEIKRDFRGYVKMAAKAGYAGLELFNCIYGGFGPQELKNYQRIQRSNGNLSELRYDSHQRSCQR